MIINRDLFNQSEINFNGVIEGSQAHILAQILAANSDRDVLFITADNIKAKLICDNINALTGKDPLCFFEWDVLPYDLISPSKAILNKRVEVLGNLISESKKKPNIVVATVEGILQKIISKKELSSHVLSLKVGDKFDRDHLVRVLIENGYVRESSANEEGEFALRGGIIDIFVVGQDCGFRLDFFGDEIDNIKQFNPSTQLTMADEKISEIIILPANEVLISQQTIENFEGFLAASFNPSVAASNPLIESLRNGVRPSGIEQWSAIFYQDTDTIFSYLNNPLIVLDSFIANNIEAHLAKIAQAYQDRIDEIAEDNKINITLKPEVLWLSKTEIKSLLSKNNVAAFHLATSKVDAVNLQISRIENFYQQAQMKQMSSFTLLNNFLMEAYKDRKNVIISSFTEGSRDRIHKTLRDLEMNVAKVASWPTFAQFIPQAHLLIAPFEQGFSCPEYVLITEQELFGQKISTAKSKPKSQLKNLLAEANNFTIGELVVHKEYGIGKFEGLETVELSQTKHDCLKIAYDGNDKLFVPVENIELITKYGNSDSEVRLDKLGGASWNLRKEKVKIKLREAAAYLMKIAAERAVKKAEALEPIQGLYEEFCATFPYAETEDQENAINEVKNDLAQDIPMDRLICGDVGFGKTEVALRAAFIAIKSEPSSLEDNAIFRIKQYKEQGAKCLNTTRATSDDVMVKTGNWYKKQVALICPTTLLARQHFKVFSERFKKFGIKVSQLSRLVSKKDSDKTIEGLASGDVDLVVGTHAILTDKVKFKNLALIIIDEEQHFGVNQKEKLKQFKENVHILSMSATPIPRTLQMSLAGIKNLSLIATPPVNRLVTKTNVIAFDPVIVREALLKEYFRGGQIFFVCPKIAHLAEIELKLKRLVPNLKIVVAHGKMPPSEIDEKMNDFYEGKYDILLSTSIIESGLDVPRVNTIMVHNAEHFGLGQLYQLRGRVGRSNVSSYAYFMVSPSKILTSVAVKRFEVLQNFEQLGSGFSIASSDMDIRGYGNLVGDAQSGHIKEVGVELYQSMLSEAIKNLKVGKAEEVVENEEKWTPQINLGISVLIPESYVKDFDLRLNLYRRVPELKEENDIISFAAEMVDRFGPLPIEVEHLLLMIKLKQFCLRAHIQKIDAGEKGIMLKLLDGKAFDADKLLKFISHYPADIKLRPENKIFIAKSIPDQEKRSIYLEKFLKDILPILE